MNNKGSQNKFRNYNSQSYNKNEVHFLITTTYLVWIYNI